MKKEKFSFGTRLSDNEMKAVKGGWTYICHVPGGEFLYTDCLEEVSIFQAQKRRQGYEVYCNTDGPGGGSGGDPIMAY